jgi:protein-S-isoprenylcysteine O-methyltransferase Ste14
MTDRSTVEAATRDEAAARHLSVAVEPPISRVAASTGLVGLLSLTAMTVFAARAEIDLARTSILCLAATLFPMMVWAVLVEKVHLNLSTGMDYSRPRPIADTIKTTRTKLVGLWATWGVIAGAHSVLTYYQAPQFGFYFQLLLWSAPALIIISIPYVFLVDRYMTEPRDALWHAGRWLVRGRDAVDAELLKEHARSWAIKGFFLAFMVSILPGVIAPVARASWDKVSADPVAFTNFAIGVIFLYDVCFGTVGYIATLRPLDSHIRSPNPFLSAWVAALACYPPFILMGDGSALDYRQGTDQWSTWFAGADLLLAAWGGVLIVLAAVYVWATIIFGFRFSNLTHRGILTNGPYRYFKHPAYLSKNLFWWMVHVPFLTSGEPWEAFRNSVMLLMVNLVYYLRAKTEERHLIKDPDYAAYSAWILDHGLVANLRRRIVGLTGSARV